MRSVVIWVVVLVLLFISSVTFTPARAETDQLFVAHAFAKCGKVLLSWESVPFADSYVIMRDEVNLKNLKSNETAYLDSSVSEGEHSYLVIAKSAGGINLSKSTPISTKVVCFDAFQCDTDMKFILGQKYYWVDETKKGPMPLPPLISQDRTFLVIRYITDELGADISWDSVLRKVTIVTVRGKVIELFIGDPIAIVNGEEIPIDADDPEVSPVIESGRTLLPVRFVSDQMGAKEVIWNAEEKSIILRFHNDSICTNQRLLLTVDSTHSEMILASDTCGNSYSIPLEEDSTFDDQLTLGDRLLVDADVTDVTTDEMFCMINLDAIDVSTVKNGKMVSGMIDKIYEFGNKGMLYLDNCGNEILLDFVIGLHGLEMVAEGSWIMTEVSEDNFIYDWNYIINDIHCGLETQEGIITRDNLTVNDLCLISSDSIQTDSIVDILYPSPGLDFISMSNDSCYKVEYKRNWLGRAICTNMNEIDCGCNIEVVPIEPNNVTILAGGTYDFRFDVKNNTDTERRISISIDGVDYFDGTVRAIPSLLTIAPGGLETIILSVTTSEETIEPIKIVYSVICANVKISNTLTLSVIDIDPQYKIVLPEGMTINNNTQFVRIPFQIQNDVEVSVSIHAKFSSSGAITNHRVEPMSAVIGPNRTGNFVAIGEMKQSRIVGETIELYITISTCGNSEITIIPIQVDRSGRAIVDIECSVDDNGLATVTGDIDWRAFTSDRIDVRWGGYGDDIETFEALPLTHQYEHPGVYPIRIYAKTLDSGMADSTGYGYCFAEYNKSITPVFSNISISVDQKDPRKFTISGTTLTSVEMIQINWGDGEITGVLKNEYSNDFIKEYTYQQFLRQEDDVEYLVLISFLEDDISNPMRQVLIGEEKLRVTVPGLYSGD